MTTVERTPTPRYALEQRERRQRRPWELLIPLAALLVGLLTFALAEGRDHDDGPVTTNPAATSGTATDPATTSGAADYRIDGTNLDAALTRQPLSTLAGSTVTATRAPVLAIAGRADSIEAHDDERFWVGDLAHPVLVFLHIPDEPPFTIGPGARVSFRGIVQPLPTPIDRLAIDPAQVPNAMRSGGYVEITDPAAIQVLR